MARIDDLLAEDDEWGFTYKSDRVRPKGSEARASSKPSPPRPSAEPPVQREVQKGLKTTGTQDTVIAKRLCKAQSFVRYPKDHPDPEKAGQPVLDSDGARKLKPCERPPMRGQEVCQKHGGLAPQAQQAAKLRLLAATEPLIAALVRIGLNETLSAADRTRAINSALDRAGFRGGIEINVDMPAWQQMLEKMFGETIDGELADKEPANVEPKPFDRAELDAMIRPRFTPDPEAPEPDPNLGYSAVHGPAVHVDSSDTPPAEWGPSLARLKRRR